MGIKGRADTREKKDRVLLRILQAWMEFPGLRLGQFLLDAAGWKQKDLFYIEDEDLAKIVEEFAHPHALPTDKPSEEGS